MPSGGSPAQSTQIVQQQLPKWVTDAGQANYAKAVQLDNSPLQQFAGSTVAAPSDATKNAFSYFTGNVDAGSPETLAAAGIYSKLADPASYQSGVNNFLNPYIDDVVNKSASDANDQLQQTVMQNNDAASKAKAFGGSRAAITNGVASAQSAKDVGLLSAQLRSAGFDDASSKYLASQGQAASGLQSVGNDEQTQMLKKFAGFEDIGQKTDANNQAVLTDQVNKFNESRDKELNDLNVRMSALGMTPYPTNSTTKSTGTAENPGTDYGALGLGLAGILAGLV